MQILRIGHVAFKLDDLFSFRGLLKYVVLCQKNNTDTNKFKKNEKIYFNYSRLY